MIHIYCGDGKGKTTCSIGLAVRALGTGMKVAFMQFLKDSESSEILVLQKLDNIDIIENSNIYGFVWNMSEQQKKALTHMHNKNMCSVFEDIKSGKYDMVVLDELCGALSCALLDRNIVIDIVHYCRENDIELVITGRSPAQFIVEKADYITEMKKIKHPYDIGVTARHGIEF